MKKKKTTRKRASKDPRKASRRGRAVAAWEPFYSIDRSFTLPTSAFSELVEIADPREANVPALRAQVQAAVSKYPSMEIALDHAPRPTRMLRNLERRLKEAETLRGWLAQPADPLAWELICEGLHAVDDTQALLGCLDKFLAAGGRVRRRIGGQESRHGPTRRALRAVIRELSCIFDFYYRGEAADLQKLKAEFVNVALSAAKIPSPKFDPASARTASRSRLRRQLPPEPCAACRAGGRDEQLVRDVVWQRIQAEAEKLREEPSELSPEQAVDAFIQTPEGKRLYEAHRVLGRVPLKTARSRSDA